MADHTVEVYAIFVFLVVFLAMISMFMLAIYCAKSMYADTIALPLYITDIEANNVNPYTHELQVHVVRKPKQKAM